MAKIDQIDEATAQRQKHVVQSVTYDWPSNLKTAEEAAADMNMSVDRILTLADGGYAPHFRIDGGPPMFRISELKRWAAAVLVERCDGARLPEPVRVVAPPSSIPDHRKIPRALREVEGLGDITSEVRRTGIYFLCHEGALLYVGKSVNAASRVAEHLRKYEVESVFFLPWPGDDLTRIEGALIRTLRPPLNGKLENGTMASAGGDKRFDAEIIAKLGIVPPPVEKEEAAA